MSRSKPILVTSMFTQDLGTHDSNAVQQKGPEQGTGKALLSESVIEQQQWPAGDNGQLRRLHSFTGTLEGSSSRRKPGCPKEHTEKWPTTVINTSKQTKFQLQEHVAGVNTGRTVVCEWQKMVCDYNHICTGDFLNILSSIPFHSIPFNSIQFNAIQFTRIQFVSIEFASILFS